MNRFFTLLLAASCLIAVGQVEFPWNPDSNGDELIGAVDLLALLSDYGLDHEVQTCFKGNICWFDQTNGINYTESGCGTLVAETASAGSAYVQNVHITSVGYNEGDVLHLVHASGSYATNGTCAIFKTEIEGNWTIVTVLGCADNLFKQSARLIFNGIYWEQLD